MHELVEEPTFFCVAGVCFSWLLVLLFRMSAVNSDLVICRFCLLGFFAFCRFGLGSFLGFVNKRYFFGLLPSFFR